VGFEPTISAGERPQTYTLDRAATGTGPRLFVRWKGPGYPPNRRLGESQSWAQCFGEDKISFPKRFPAPDCPANSLVLAPTTQHPSLEKQRLEQILLLTNKSSTNVPCGETADGRCFLSSHEFVSDDHTLTVGISLLLVTSVRELGIQSTLLRVWKC